MAVLTPFAPLVILAASLTSGFAAFFPQLLAILTLGMAAWIRHAIVTPKDHERAAEISTIAKDVAAAVVAESQGKPWATLLQLTIAQLSDAVGATTSNQDAIRRAATSALLAQGAKPS